MLCGSWRMSCLLTQRESASVIVAQVSSPGARRLCQNYQRAAMQVFAEQMRAADLRILPGSGHSPYFEVAPVFNLSLIHI